MSTKDKVKKLVSDYKKSLDNINKRIEFIEEDLTDLSMQKDEAIEGQDTVKFLSLEKEYRAALIEKSELIEKKKEIQSNGIMSMQEFEDLSKTLFDEYNVELRNSLSEYMKLRKEMFKAVDEPVKIRNEGNALLNELKKYMTSPTQSYILDSSALNEMIKLNRLLKNNIDITKLESYQQKHNI